MRILQVIRDMDPASGGPPRVVEGLSVGLAQLGCEVEIAAITYGTECQARLAAAWPSLGESGVNFRGFAPSGPAPFGASSNLATFLRKSVRSFDIVHLHGVWDQVLVSAANAAYKANVPYLVSPHGMLDNWSMRRSRLKKAAAWHLLGVGRMLKQASTVVYGTKSEALEASGLRIVSPARVAPNGFWSQSLEALSSNARQRLAVQFPETASWSTCVLFYSRVHPKKGLDMLIEAFTELADEFPGAGLLVAGIQQDRAYEAEVRKQIRATNRPGRIVFTTALTGPESRFVYHAADIFVLPSHQEGFSIAIVEALACGRPVLITDRCHMDEVLAWGAGQVTAPTSDGIAAGMRVLLEMDAASRAEAGCRGRSRVLETLTWPKVAARMRTIYADLADA